MFLVVGGGNGVGGDCGKKREREKKRKAKGDRYVKDMKERRQSKEVSSKKLKEDEALWLLVRLQIWMFFFFWILATFWSY